MKYGSKYVLYLPGEFRPVWEASSGDYCVMEAEGEAYGDFPVK